VSAGNVGQSWIKTRAGERQQNGTKETWGRLPYIGWMYIPADRSWSKLQRPYLRRPSSVAVTGRSGGGHSEAVKVAGRSKPPLLAVGRPNIHERDYFAIATDIPSL
jgi:hypothetical protein